MKRILQRGVRQEAKEANGAHVRKSLSDRDLGAETAAPNGFSERNHLADWGGYLLAVRGLAPATVARYLALVERYLGAEGGFTRDGIEKHLKKLYLAGVGGSVRQGVVAALRSYCEWAAARGHLATSNPTLGLRSPKAPLRRAVKPFSPAEIARLIWGERVGYLPRDPLELRDRALLAVTYAAGLRASEVGRLRYPEDVDWAEGREMFRVRVAGKGASEEAWLWVEPLLSRVLGAYLTQRGEVGDWLFRSERGRPVSRARVRQILLRRIREAGIVPAGRRLSPHILRHSVATHLLIDRRVDVRTVQLHLRHRSLATTEQYLHSGSSRVAAALARRSPLRAAAVKDVPLLSRVAAELGALAGE